MATIRLSQQGIASDAELHLNSTIFGADQTEAIQNIFTNCAPNDTIIIDVKASAEQVRPKGKTTVIHEGANGFIQRDNSNKPFILNANPTNATIIDEDITWKSDEQGLGIINGNGYRNNAPTQQKETSQGWAVGMRIAGVRNLNVEGINFVNCRTFASFVSNFENVRFNEPSFIANGLQNQDGFKFLVGKTLRVQRPKGYRTGDDLLSVCAEDIFFPQNPPPVAQNGGQTAYDPWAIYGDITDIDIDILTNSAGLYGIRILSAGSLVDLLTIKNSNLVTKSVGVIMDNYSESPLNLYAAPDSPRIANFGRIRLLNMNIGLTGTNGYKEAGVYFKGNADEFIIQNYKNSNSAFPGLPMLRIANDSVIEKMVRNNFTVPAGQTGLLIDPSLEGRPVGVIKNNIIKTGTLFKEAPNMLRCKTTAAFADLGLNATNIKIIYEYVSEGVNLVWEPDGEQEITQFTAGKMYHIIALQDMTLPGVFV